MALEKRIVPVPLDGTNAGGSEPRSLTNGLAVVENGVFRRKDAVSRRNALKTSTTGLASIDFGDHWVYAGASDSNSYTNRIKADGSIETKTIGTSAVTPIFANVDVKPIDFAQAASSSTYDAYWTECVQNDSFLVVSQLINGSSASRVLTTMTLTSSGPVYSSTLSLGSSYSGAARLVKTANGNIACFYLLTSTSIKYRVLNNTTGAWGSEDTVTLSGGHVPTNEFLAVCALTGDVVAIAFMNASDDLCATTEDVIASTSSGTTYTTTTVDEFESVDVCQWDGGSTFVVVWGNSTDWATVRLNTTCSAVKGPTTTTLAGVEHVSCEPQIYDTVAGDATVNIVISARNGNVRPTAYHNTYTEPGGTATHTTDSYYQKYGVPVSSPVYFSHTGQIYPTYYFQGANWWKSSPTDLDAATVQRMYYIGKNKSCVFLPGYGGHNLLSSPAALNNALYLYQMVPKAQRLSDTTYQFTAFKHVYPANRTTVLVTVTLPNRVLTRTVNNVGYVAGNAPLQHDGDSFAEAHITQYPEGLTSALTATGSGSWAAGVYSYVAVYEAYNSRGQLIQSAPSPAHTVTITSADLTKTNTITIPTCLDTLGLSNSLRCAIYRTAANGTRYYRIGATANSLTSDTVTFTDNDTVTLTDDNADGIVPLVEVLYTDGGVIEHTVPAPHKWFCIHQNRYVLADSDNARTKLLFSREMAPTIGVPFNDTLEVSVSADGGDITALESLDTFLAVFKRDRIFAIGGYGPDDTGGGAQYGKPQLISEGVGCVNGFSVARCPLGLMFVSARGIQLLDRGGAVTSVGDKVRYYTDTYSYDCAATDIENGYVAFTSQTGLSPVLVFDYIHMAWTVWTLGTHSGVAFCKSLGGKLQFSMLSANTNNTDVYDAQGGYYYSDQFGDDGSSTKYYMRIVTNWLNPYSRDQKFRFYRAIVHAYAKTASIKYSIKCAVGYDYDPTFGRTGVTNHIQSREIDTTTVSDGESANQFGIDHYFKHEETFPSSTKHEGKAIVIPFSGTRQRVKAIRLQIYDDRVSSGEGTYYTMGDLEIAGVTIVCGILGPVKESTALGEPTSAAS